MMKSVKSSRQCFSLLDVRKRLKGFVRFLAKTSRVNKNWHEKFVKKKLFFHVDNNIRVYSYDVRS